MSAPSLCLPWKASRLTPGYESQRGEWAAKTLYGHRTGKRHTANNSPIARALGDDFINLHTAVRKHYSEPTVVLSGVMDSINVKTAIRPAALLSYMLFRAPVPRSGENVEFTVHSRVDGSGVMHWLRTFYGSDGLRRDVTFSSHMAFSGDHRIMETTRWGLGVESDLRVDHVGSLVYEIPEVRVKGTFFLG